MLQSVENKFVRMTLEQKSKFQTLWHVWFERFGFICWYCSLWQTFITVKKDHNTGTSAHSVLYLCVPGQQWYQDRQKQEQEKAAEAKAKAAPPAPAATAKPGAAAAGRGGAAAGRGTTPAPAARGRGAAAPPARGGQAFAFTDIGYGLWKEGVRKTAKECYGLLSRLWSWHHSWIVRGAIFQC